MQMPSSRLSWLVMTAWLVGPVFLPAQSVNRLSDDKISAATKLAKDHPTDATWVKLGDALLLQARDAADPSFFGRAEKAYQSALDLNPKSVDALIGMAWLQNGRREFEHSIQWAEKALALNEKQVDAYGLLGDAAVEMGDYEKALERYQKMLDLRPDMSSYSRGARIMFLTGNVKKSAFLYGKALGASAGSSGAESWCMARLAQLQFAQGAYVPAAQLLARGLEKTPANPDLLATMGKVKGGLKDYDSAISYYKKAQALRPNIELASALGDLYLMQGQTDAANRQFEMVDNMHRANVMNGVRDNLERARFLSEHDRDLTGALKIAEDEYKARPSVYAADTLAWCFLKNGKIAEAKNYILKAVSRTTPEASFYYHKGVIFAKAGDVGSARTFLYQALSMNPNFDPRSTLDALKWVQQLGEVAVTGEEGR